MILRKTSSINYEYVHFIWSICLLLLLFCTRFLRKLLLYKCSTVSNGEDIAVCCSFDLAELESNVCVCLVCMHVDPFLYQLIVATVHDA